MLRWLTKSPDLRHRAGNMYARIIDVARHPGYYERFGVPDTAEGRFEVVVLHIFLALERLKKETPDGDRLSRRIIENFVTDMDDCMREMGVGDLTVPKRVKRAAAVFYERAGQYRDVLRSPDNTSLIAMLSEHVVGAHATSSDAAAALAERVRLMADEIAAVPIDSIYDDAMMQAVKSRRPQV